MCDFVGGADGDGDAKCGGADASRVIAAANAEADV